MNWLVTILLKIKVIMYNNFSLPKVIWNPVNVLLESLGVRAISMPTHQHLDHLGDLNMCTNLNE